MGSWEGTKVRNLDGRTGKISSEFAGFGFQGLNISLDAGAPEAYVQLNNSGSDAGESGWEWYCEDFDGGPRWLPLGNHGTDQAITH